MAAAATVHCMLSSNQSFTVVSATVVGEMYTSCCCPATEAAVLHSLVVVCS